MSLHKVEEGEGEAGSLAAESGPLAGDGAIVVSASPDPGGVRATDGLAGRLDDRERVAFVKGKRAQSAEDDESWRGDDVSPTLNSFDVGDTRATTLVADTLNSGGNDGGFRTEPGAHLAIGGGVADDPLLPLGLDSHRYRCCGNGVVANVARWIGERLPA